VWLATGAAVSGGGWAYNGRVVGAGIGGRRIAAAVSTDLLNGLQFSVTAHFGLAGRRMDFTRIWAGP